MDIRPPVASETYWSIMLGEAGYDGLVNYDEEPPKPPRFLIPNFFISSLPRSFYFSLLF